MTLPGTTLGSVHYFSPEQARGEPATTASDIYSLGIVLYEMLTGVRPWEGDSAASVALARLTGPIPDPVDRPAVRPARPRRDHPQGARARARTTGCPRRRRWPTPSMATLAPGGRRGRRDGAAAAGRRGAAAATMAPRRARPNPSGVPYAPDAYVGADRAGRPTTPPPPLERAHRPRTRSEHQPARLGRRRRRRPPPGGHRLPRLPARRRRWRDAVRSAVGIAVASVAS